jgi:hypothetical protein
MYRTVLFVAIFNFHLINIFAQNNIVKIDSLELIEVDLNLNMKQVCYLWKIDLHNCLGLRTMVFNNLKYLHGLTKNDIIKILGKPDLNIESDDSTLKYYGSWKRCCKNPKKKLKADDISGEYDLYFINGKFVEAVIGAY